MTNVVIVVDTLRGFLEAGYPLYCGPAARSVVAPIHRLLERERAAGSAHHLRGRQPRPRRPRVPDVPAPLHPGHRGGRGGPGAGAPCRRRRARTRPATAASTAPALAASLVAISTRRRSSSAASAATSACCTPWPTPAIATTRWRSRPAAWPASTPRRTSGRCATWSGCWAQRSPGTALGSRPRPGVAGSGGQIRHRAEGAARHGVPVRSRPARAPCAT